MTEITKIRETNFALLYFRTTQLHMTIKTDGRGKWAEGERGVGVGRGGGG